MKIEKNAQRGVRHSRSYAFLAPGVDIYMLVPAMLERLRCRRRTGMLCSTHARYVAVQAIMLSTAVTVTWSIILRVMGNHM